MFKVNAEQQAIIDGVTAVCTRFGDDYWAECDQAARFPREFHRAIADAGWLGVTMPEAYGGAGLGIKEASLVMHTVAQHGGAMAAASSIHMNMFGPHPMVVHGTPDQKSRWIPRLVTGSDQVCFGVTEPDAGLDTTSIRTFAKKVEGGYCVSGRKMWTSTAQIANKILLLARTSAKPPGVRASPPTACRSFTPMSIAQRSRSAGSRSTAGLQSIRTQSSSMICSFPSRT